MAGLVLLQQAASVAWCHWAPRVLWTLQLVRSACFTAACFALVFTDCCAASRLACTGGLTPAGWVSLQQTAIESVKKQRKVRHRIAVA